MDYVPVIVLGCCGISQNGISRAVCVFVTHAANRSRQSGARLGIARQLVEKKLFAKRNKLASRSVPFFRFLLGLINWNSLEKTMTTAVQLDNVLVELSQPFKHRPDVIVIATSDGRRTVIGDGQDPFTADEYRQIDRTRKFGQGS